MNHTNMMVYKTNKFEGIWRHSFKISDTDYDSNGNALPYIYPSKSEWNKNVFIEKLHKIETKLIKKKKFINLYGYNRKSCHLDGAFEIETKLFYIKNNFWPNSLLHYVTEHNVKPSDEFINLIMASNINYSGKIHMVGLTYVKSPLKYFKITENQMMILDALMYHGSYTKKYADINNPEIHRYSEHMGLLDFDKHGLEKIIISGNTTRTDKNDNEIYFPENMPETYEHEYFFHTHPATPKPGGRADGGVLYEFPSISDIYHFIDHYNNGVTQGSIVISAEGVYIIRKLLINNKKIVVPNGMAQNLKRQFDIIQAKAIKRYGTNFTNSYFYSKIAQDFTFIKMMNYALRYYDLYIDYKARVKNRKGTWVISDIYVPVYFEKNT